MEPAPVRVVLDANVLFPFTLRDTLLRAGAAGYLQVVWSDEILDEARRSLVRSGTLSEPQAARLIAAMTSAFPEAQVTGFEALIPAMRNEANDRHVVAAAVKAEAQLIVTSNLKDFVPLPEGIEARSPDDLLLRLYDFDPDGMLDLLREQAAALRNPPRSVEELVTALAKLAPGFAASARAALTTPE